MYDNFFSYSKNVMQYEEQVICKKKSEEYDQDNVQIWGGKKITILCDNDVSMWWLRKCQKNYKNNN